MKVAKLFNKCEVQVILLCMKYAHMGLLLFSQKTTSKFVVAAAVLCPNQQIGVDPFCFFLHESRPWEGNLEGEKLIPLSNKELSSDLSFSIVLKPELPFLFKYKTQSHLFPLYSFNLRRLTVTWPNQFLCFSLQVIFLSVFFLSLLSLLFICRSLQ